MTCIFKITQKERMRKFFLLCLALFLIFNSYLINPSPLISWRSVGRYIQQKHTGYIGVEAATFPTILRYRDKLVR